MIDLGQMAERIVVVLRVSICYVPRSLTCAAAVSCFGEVDVG
jgi:hypothetical protein